MIIGKIKTSTRYQMEENWLLDLQKYLHNSQRYHNKNTAFKQRWNIRFHINKSRDCTMQLWLKYLRDCLNKLPVPYSTPVLKAIGTATKIQA